MKAARPAVQRRGADLPVEPSTSQPSLVWLLGHSPLSSVRVRSMFQQASAKSGDTWQELMELRCQREVIERWLASCSLPDDLQQNLYAMLREIDDQLQMRTKQLAVRSGEGL
jgi:hypothetical protein